MKTIITAILVLISFNLFAQKQKEVKIDFVPEYLKQAKSIEVKIFSEYKSVNKLYKKNDKNFHPFYIKNSDKENLKKHIEEKFINNRQKKNSNAKLDLLFTVNIKGRYYTKKYEGTTRTYYVNGGYRESSFIGERKSGFGCTYNINVVDKATKEKLFSKEFYVYAKNDKDIIKKTIKKIPSTGIVPSNFSVKINNIDIIEKIRLLNKETLQELINKGQNPNYKCMNLPGIILELGKKPLLMHCAFSKDLMFVLFKNGATSIGWDDDGKTILDYYYLYGYRDYKLLELILKNGLDINKISSFSKTTYDKQFIPVEWNDSKYTPIYYPFKNRNFDFMKLMIKYGANLNVGFSFKSSYGISKTTNEYSLLGYATKNADLKMMRFLIKNGAGVNFHYKEKTALDVYKKDNKKVKMYLDSLGAIKYEEFNRAYDQKEYDKIIKYMLSGFPVSSKQFIKIKPYLLTKIKEYPKLLEEIKKAETKINIKKACGVIVNNSLDSLKEITALLDNDFFETPDLLRLASRNNKIDIASFLLQNGADVNYIYRKYIPTPIFEAKSKEMISLLMKNGADVSIKNYKGKNVFEYFIHNVEFTEAIIKGGMDPNLIIESDRRIPTSPLQIACGSIMSENNTLHIAKLLIEAGANIENIDKALRSCVYRRKTKVAKYLIDKGADPFKISKYEYTPYKLAKNKGQKELVKYMKSKR